MAPLEPLATPVSRLPPPAARCKALQSPSTRTAVASPPGELTRARPMHTGTPPSMLAAHVSAPSILKVTTSRPLPTQDGWSYRPDQGLSTASTACTPLTACALARIATLRLSADRPRACHVQMPPEGCSTERKRAKQKRRLLRLSERGQGFRSSGSPTRINQERVRVGLQLRRQLFALSPRPSMDVEATVLACKLMRKHEGLQQRAWQFGPDR